MNELTIRTVAMGSREIAELTGKQHKDVLYDIDKMLSDMDLATADFSAMYKADNGQEYRCYNLPAREVMILVTGYSIPLRAKVIDRLNELEKGASKPLSALEIMAQQVKILQEQEARVLALETKVNEIEAHGVTSNNDFFTIAGYSALRGLQVDISRASLLGRKAAKISKETDTPMGKITDPRFGQANTYHVDVLKEVFA